MSGKVDIPNYPGAPLPYGQRSRPRSVGLGVLCYRYQGPANKRNTMFLEVHWFPSWGSRMTSLMDARKNEFEGRGFTKIGTPKINPKLVGSPYKRTPTGFN